MKKAIELAKKTDIRGIKIQIVGRLNGAEIARVEWAKKVEFLYKLFKLELVIVTIRLRLFMEY
jgi:ribosomal protein S3